jgi:hypothetical protein
LVSQPPRRGYRRLLVIGTIGEIAKLHGVSLQQLTSASQSRSSLYSKPDRRCRATTARRTCSNARLVESRCTTGMATQSWPSHGLQKASPPRKVSQRAGRRERAKARARKERAKEVWIIRSKLRPLLATGVASMDTRRPNVARSNATMQHAGGVVPLATLLRSVRTIYTYARSVGEPATLPRFVGVPLLKSQTRQMQHHRLLKSPSRDWIRMDGDATRVLAKLSTHPLQRSAPLAKRPDLQTMWGRMQTPSVSNSKKLGPKWWRG